MKKKRIIILGSGGFVSSAVEKLLYINNFKVVALKRKNLDLEKTSSIIKLQKKIKKNDIVFFIAANAPVKTFKQFDKKYENLLKYLRKFDKKKGQKINLS